LDHYPVNIFRPVLFHNPAFLPDQANPYTAIVRGAATGRNIRQLLGALEDALDMPFF